MSEETKSALDAALQAHVADECDGSIVTGYVLFSSHFNAEMDERGSTGYFAEFQDRQSYHVGLGLAHQLVDHYGVIFGDDDD